MLVWDVGRNGRKDEVVDRTWQCFQARGASDE